MAKTNAKKCADYRARQKRLPRPVKMAIPDGTRRALDELKAWHGYDDDAEAVATMIHRLHEQGEAGSRHAFAVATHDYTPTPELLERLQGTADDAA